MSCKHCHNQAVYTCSVCGKPLCPQHTRLRTVCPTCQKKTTQNYTITIAKTKKEKEKIRKFVEHFWGEQEQLTFNRRFIVTKLPTYIAKTQNTTIIVALGILPKYQNTGIGKALTKKVEIKAKQSNKKQLLVSTSNDDLPALAFYQKLGFQIYQVKPNAIAEKHGKTIKGINGIPVRDEIRLRKIIH
ncbi:MAG: GNAT family N-acetyltransferase [Candidatus Bathyarchaeota archaeon]|jgi:GNAT superfamily N-acetyltransferase|nr:GNAT family N-acetyltransferase [Candidatus Bathyarchaeota archaeon A05DMB-5]MDH7557289.1 GNAT family N-acetyltransferase [Candidatus Bathyarchaeota archaeon]